MADQAPLTVGLIGYGMAGRVFHAPVIASVETLALSAIASSRRAEIAEAWPGVAVFASVDEMLAAGPPDIAVVAVPNAWHAPLAMKALDAGCHVVVDKPMCVTGAEARGLIAHATARGRMLVPFHNRRWDGDFLTVRGLIDSGRLGRLHSVSMSWDRYRPDPSGNWREDPDQPGAGLLYDLGPHLIDQALTLFGEPDAVAGTVRRVCDHSRVPDSFDLALSYPGLEVRLGVNSLMPLARPRFALHGRAASFVKLGLDPQEAALKAGERPGGPDWGREPEDRFGRLVTPDGAAAPVPTVPGGYDGFYRQLAEAVRGAAPPPVAAEDGARVVEIIEQAMAGG